MNDGVILLGKVNLKTGSQVRVTKGEFKGKEYIDIREYYLTEENFMAVLRGEKDTDEVDWLPTKKGIHLGVEQFDELMMVLSEIGTMNPDLPEEEPVAEGEVG